MALVRIASVMKTRKKKRLANSRIKLKESKILKNKSRNFDNKYGSFENCNSKMARNKKNSKRAKNVRKKYSEKRSTKSVEKKPKIGVASKPGHNSGKSLKKNKTHLSKYRKDLNSSLKYLVPYSSEFSQKESSTREKQTEELTDTASESGESTEGVAKKMIFVSLDFLEECQKYKRKFRKRLELKESKPIKTILKICSGSKTSLAKRQGTWSQNFKKAENENKHNCKMTILIVNKKGERETIYEDSLQRQEKKGTEGKIKIKVTAPEENAGKAENIQEIIEKHLEAWPNFPKKEPSEENISKIDSQYIKSLLLIANGEKPDKTESGGEHQKLENQIFTKEKITGKAFFESKKRKKRTKEKKIIPTPERKTKNVTANKLGTLTEGEIKPSEIPIAKENLEQRPSNKNIKKSISRSRNSRAKLFRVLTQSENQFKLAKTLQSTKDGVEETKVKNEKVAYSKVEINDDRKKRKGRNYNVKKNKLNLAEISASCELSKQADVKEIWRRVKNKVSENSLSSHSSTTMAGRENGMESPNLGMQSYKILKKIVETEIFRISRNYINKEKGEKIASKEKEEKKCDNVKEKKAEDNVKKEKINEVQRKNFEKGKKKDEERYQKGDIKNSDDLLNGICKQITTTSPENFGDFLDGGDEELDFFVKRRLLNQQKYLQNSDLNEKGDMHKIYPKTKSDDLREEEKISTQEKSKKKKLPSEAVENWSILHRLEKAFLALGGPNFQNKTFKDSNRMSGLKLKRASANETHERFEGGKNKKIEEGIPEFENKRKPNEDTLKKKPSIKNIDISVTEKVSGESDKQKKRTKNEADILDFCSTQKFQEETSKIVENAQYRKAENEVKRNYPKLKQVNRLKKEWELTNQKADVANSTLTKKTEFEEGNKKQRKDTSVSRRNTNSTFFKSFPKERSTLRSGDCVSEQRTANQTKMSFNENVEINSLMKWNEVHGEKSGKKKSSRVSVNSSDDSNKNFEENLERKRTFDVISGNDSFNIQVRKSKSCTELDRNSDLELKTCFSSKIEQESRDSCKKNLDFWNFFEENERMSAEHKSKNCDWDNDQSDRSSVGSSKKPGKKQVKEKINYTRRNGLNEKTIDRENTKGIQETCWKIINTKGNIEKKFERIIPTEGARPQIILTRKDQNKNIPNERAVKERSILSISGNQTPLKNYSPALGSRKHEKIPEQKDVCTLLQKNLHDSDVSFVSTKTYDIIDPALHNTPLNKQALNVNYRKTLTAGTTDDLSSFSDVSTKTYDAVPTTSKITDLEDRSKKPQPLWEQDIRCYRAIVKDIINQYKRLDGLLKQSDHSNGDILGSESWSIKDDSVSNSTPSQQTINIHEYRKKIISQYTELPIFEYKSKIQEKEGKEKLEEVSTKRNLLAVKALNTEMDLDVKDFQPNIKKVLDSQFYVDTENMFKRNPPLTKFKETKPSLQDIILLNKKGSANEIQSEKWQRAISSPKTVAFLPQSSSSKILEKPEGTTLNSVVTNENLLISDLDQSDSDLD